MIKIEESGKEEIKKEKALPIGKAAELEATKETLPAIEVKNHVLWVNPAFPELPFSIEEGKPTKLGMFLTPSYTEKKAYELEVNRGHQRSGIVGRVIFKDQDGRLYRDIDLKGSGFVPTHLLRVGDVAPIDAKEATGVLDLAAAFHDKEMTEEFLKKGIRTNRIVAIIKLEEIVDVGYDGGARIISISDAKKENIIPESNTPVVVLRAFGTKIRLSDVEEELGVFNSNGRKGNNVNLYLEDARLMLAAETGKNPDRFTQKDYLLWLAKTFGKNLGIMHKNWWYHGYIRDGHNTTLDGCFVDLDSVTKIDPSSPNLRDKFNRDGFGLRDALESFLVALEARGFKANKDAEARARINYLLSECEAEYEIARGKINFIE